MSGIVERLREACLSLSQGNAAAHYEIQHLLSEARRQAFIEAAEIAEDKTRDFCREGYVLTGPSGLGRNISAALRAKAEEA